MGGASHAPVEFRPPVGQPWDAVGGRRAAKLGAMRFSASLGPLVVLATLVGCSSAERAASKAGADAKNATSPIVGSWKLGGDTPAPKANLPQFVRLTFTAGGKLDASYVAAGGALAKVIDTPSKLKEEHDSYTLGSDEKLTIIEGSRTLDYTYKMSDGKLLLTPSGADNAIVFVQA